LAQQIGEIARARVMGRGLEGPAERRRDPGVSGRNIYSNDLAVHGLKFRRRNVFSFQLHLQYKRPKGLGSFALRQFAAMKIT
jgi:hypothetical protein